jgi:hypothetical protein
MSRWRRPCWPLPIWDVSNGGAGEQAAHLPIYGDRLRPSFHAEKRVVSGPGCRGWRWPWSDWAHVHGRWRRGRAAGCRQIAPHRIGAVLVTIALSAALIHGDARRFAGLAALLVGHALDALALGVASGPARRLVAVDVAEAFDTQSRRGVAGGLFRIAVRITGARSPTATAPHVACPAGLAVTVVQALDAAAVSRVAHLARTLAGIDTLDALPTRDVAGRPVRRAMRIDQALDAAPPAIARGVSRLRAVAVADALHAHVELARAAAQRLPRAVARVATAQGAAREHVIAALVRRTVVGRAALDAHVALAGRLGGATVPVDQALAAGATGAKPTFARAIARVSTLERPARQRGKELQRAALIQVAAQRGDAKAEPGTQRSHGHGRALHGAAGSASINSRASSRAKPSGCRSRYARAAAAACCRLPIPFKIRNRSTRALCERSDSG